MISGRNHLVGTSRQGIFARHMAKAQGLSRRIRESRERERDLESEKLKFPEDFFAYENPDCPDKDIEKAVNRMKNWMKGETYKSNPWFFMAAGNYLIVGLIAEDGQKTIYVARQYYEIVNIPGEGWLRESGAECPF